MDYEIERSFDPSKCLKAGFNTAVQKGAQNESARLSQVPDI